MNSEDIAKIKRLLETMLNNKNVAENFNKIKDVLKNNSKGNKELIKMIESVSSANNQIDAILLIEAWQIRYERLLYSEVGIGKLLMKPGNMAIKSLGPLLGDLMYRKTYSSFKATVEGIMRKYNVKKGSN